MFSCQNGPFCSQNLPDIASPSPTISLIILANNKKWWEYQCIDTWRVRGYVLMPTVASHGPFWGRKAPHWYGTYLCITLDVKVQKCFQEAILKLWWSFGKLSFLILPSDRNFSSYLTDKPYSGMLEERAPCAIRHRCPEERYKVLV